MSRVSETIYEQMGARKFAIMTGAKNFLDLGNGLSFQIPGGGGVAKDGINNITITLKPDDFYNMKFYRRRGKVLKLVEERGGPITWDMLQSIFTEVTGLATSLGSMGRKSA